MLGLRPTKRRGQNFLVDPNTVRRLVKLADIGPSDVVLEIGPGLGSFTLGLLSRAARVVAVEVDPVLAAALPATASARLPASVAERLVVIAADGLRVGPGDLPPEATVPTGPTVLAANLPYNVAVPLLLGLLERFPEVRRGLVMVQAEVAERLAAPPGSRAYGVPSVKLAWYAAARRVGPVPRTVFWPVPHVDSALLSFTRHDPPPGADRDEVFRLVDVAFAQRRKALRAALASWAGTPVAAEEALRAAGIDPMARAETLGIGDFARLATVQT